MFTLKKITKIKISPSFLTPYKNLPNLFHTLNISFIKSLTQFFLLILSTSMVVSCGGGGSSAPSNENAKGTTLTVTANSTTVATAGYPWEAVITPSGALLVSVTSDGTSESMTGVQVFEPVNGVMQSHCVNALSSTLLGSNTLAANLSLFPGSTDIAAGIGFPGAIFYHVADLLACNPSGYVVGQGSTSSNNAGTLNVAVTPDGNFAFVSNEYGVAPGTSTSGNIGVVAIQRDANGNFTAGTTLIGQIATGGNAIAGMMLSPDGTRLYVTSEVAAVSTQMAASGNAVLFKSGCTQAVGSPNSINGILTVIDVAIAKTTPDSGAILTTIAAGCSPTRMAETSDGKTLWLTARGDDRILAFSTQLLESNPNNSLLGYANTGGTAPVGIHLFHNDQLLAVANSNRFNTGTANVSIMNVTSPSSANVVQMIPTGLFPREVTVGPDDATLYLTNYLSESIQIIQTSVN
jgi:DNA-binding beta-propeller fold protein YncE